MRGEYRRTLCDRTNPAGGLAQKRQRDLCLHLFDCSERGPCALAPALIIMNCHEPTSATASDFHRSALSKNRRDACCATPLPGGGRLGAANHRAKVEGQRCRRPFVGYTTAQLSIARDGYAVVYPTNGRRHL